MVNSRTDRKVIEAFRQYQLALGRNAPADELAKLVSKVKLQLDGARQTEDYLNGRTTTTHHLGADSVCVEGINI